MPQLAVYSVVGLACLVALTSASVFSHAVHSLEHNAQNTVEKTWDSADSNVVRNEHALENDVHSATREIAETVQSSIGHVSDDSGCECVDDDCGCCAYLSVPDIHLDDTVCVNVTYYPDQYGVGLSVTIDDYAIINMTVSAKNPPPVCAGVPFLEEAASICIDLYDLDVSNTTFSGCVKLEVRLYHVLVKDFDLGCFSMPLGKHSGQLDLSYMGTSRMRVV